jgi:hypothetical protein
VEDLLSKQALDAHAALDLGPWDVRVLLERPEAQEATT